MVVDVILHPTFFLIGSSRRETGAYEITRTCANTCEGEPAAKINVLLQALTVDFNRWGSMTPLHQFKGVPTDVVRKAEGKQFVSIASLFFRFEGD